MSKFKKLEVGEMDSISLRSTGTGAGGAIKNPLHLESGEEVDSPSSSSSSGRKNKSVRIHDNDDDADDHHGHAVSGHGEGEDIVQDMAAAGAAMYTVHVKPTPKGHLPEDLTPLIKQAKKAGMKVGCVIKPKVTVDEVKRYLKMVDHVLVLTVEDDKKAGFAAKKFNAEMVNKVKELKALSPAGVVVEVDGELPDHDHSHDVAPTKVPEWLGDLLEKVFHIRRRNTTAEVRKSKYLKA